MLENKFIDDFEEMEVKLNDFKDFTDFADFCRKHHIIGNLEIQYDFLVGDGEITLYYEKQH